MTERDNLTNPRDSEKYSQTMKDSHNELDSLRAELQNLMVRFGLRALRLYQTGTKVPLRPMEIASLLKYELNNVFLDLKEEANMNAIIEQTKAEWQKLQEQQGQEETKEEK